MFSTEKLKDGTIIIWFSCGVGIYPLMRLTQEEARHFIEDLTNCLDDIPEAFKAMDN